MIQGVDGSEFSGVPDYGWLRERGASFAVPRIASGAEHRDALAEAHIRAAGEAGVDVPAGYAYLRSWVDGAAQAEFAHRTMRALGLAHAFVDLEPVTSGHRAEDAPAYARLTAHAYLRRWVDLEGAPAPVYGPLYYLAALDLDPALVGPLWVAQVGKNGLPLAGPPKVPAPWPDWAVHQFQHGADGGRGSKVDWNRSRLTLDGLRAALRGDGRRGAPAEVLAGVLRTSDLAAGRAPGGSAEDFASRDEGPVVE